MTVCKFLCKFSTCRHKGRRRRLHGCGALSGIQRVQGLPVRALRRQKIPCTVAAVTGETEKIDYTGIIPETEEKVK